MPEGQAWPQAPQFRLSVAVLVQLLPHPVSPGGQAQAPCVQASPAPHAWPHAPQLALSVCTLVQAPPQSSWEEGHCVVHAPATHAWPALHACPHAPQFKLSVAVFAH